MSESVSLNLAFWFHSRHDATLFAAELAVRGCSTLLQWSGQAGEWRVFTVPNRHINENELIQQAFESCASSFSRVNTETFDSFISTHGGCHGIAGSAGHDGDSWAKVEKRQAEGDSCSICGRPPSGDIEWEDHNGWHCLPCEWEIRRTQ